MATLFENIMNGDLPGRFVWADNICVSFATIAPIRPGHVLVVPRTPYPAWTDAPVDVLQHLTSVSQTIGQVQVTAYGVKRSGLIIAGFEVPHTHLHVVPMNSEKDIAFARATPATAEELDNAMTILRQGLVDAGHGSSVPENMDSPLLRS